MCSHGVAVNSGEFFATKETSAGFGKCYSVFGGDGTGRDDIWGCAQPTAAVIKSNPCGILGYTIANSNFNNWDIGSNITMEASNIKLTDSVSGGVLCCVDS